MNHDLAASAAESVELLGFQIGQWEHLEYPQNVPPLGQRNTEAIIAGHAAIETIDKIIRSLHELRGELIGELRQDEDIRASFREVVGSVFEETSTPDLDALAELMRREPWADRVLIGQVASGNIGGRGSEQRLDGRLWLAPRGRYRAELADEDGETEVRISDGDSVWFIQADQGYRFDVANTVRPFPDLMEPGWLFAEFQLQVASRRRHAVRDCYVLNGTNPAEKRRSFLTRELFPRASDVEALVDCELGLLLSYEKSTQAGATEYARFTSLEVHESVDASLFRPPADIPIIDDRAAQS
jgi:outer membrane lipoprotein-sorting protein